MESLPGTKESPWVVEPVDCHCLNKTAASEFESTVPVSRKRNRFELATDCVVWDGQAIVLNVTHVPRLGLQRKEITESS
mgnify:CR=1 FL=1